MAEPSTIPEFVVATLAMCLLPAYQPQPGTIAEPCGNGPVVITVTGLVEEDCNHCAPTVTTERQSDGTYARTVGSSGSCTLMVCGAKRETWQEVWTDYPECGGMR